MINLFYYETKLGTISIAEENGYITNIYTGKLKLDTNYVLKETDLIRTAFVQISEYLDAKRKEFNLPLNPKGTNFQKRVWDKLRTIKYGETKSYMQIAELVGNPKACRAVGNANNKNPILLAIPCHRVIGKDGKLVGFGAGLDVKKFLLELESNNKL